MIGVAPINIARIADTSTIVLVAFILYVVNYYNFEFCSVG